MAPRNAIYWAALKRVFVLLLLCAPLAGQPQTMRVGSIDFFGTKGIDVAAVRAALPLHPGDTISEAKFPTIKQNVGAAVRREAGGPMTDFSVVCCDAHDGLMIYIGLPGKNSREIAHLPPPTGSACLPPEAVKLYDDAMTAVMQAVEAGDSGEDDSRGYSLGHNPGLRRSELKMRAYAVAHTAQVEKALRGCSRAHDRQAASELLGYANASPAQIATLVRASNDADPAVRNNAVRALAVLASSKLPAASQIPAGQFVAMLNSGKWEDRNKSGLLLMKLSLSRNPKLLAELRAQAFDSLVEMARWQEPGHAYAYRELLGRIAGLDEPTIQQWMAAGKVEDIIAAAERKSRP